jgi:hypothetical protein
MQAATETMPEDREERHSHENERGAEILHEHQSQVREQGLKVPTFVEVLDNAPKRPEASNQSGYAEGQPPHQSTLVNLLHHPAPQQFIYGLPFVRDIYDKKPDPDDKFKGLNSIAWVNMVIDYFSKSQ